MDGLWRHVAILDPDSGVANMKFSGRMTGWVDFMKHSFLSRLSQRFRIQLAGDLKIMFKGDLK